MQQIFIHLERYSYIVKFEVSRAKTAKFVVADVFLLIRRSIGVGSPVVVNGETLTRAIVVRVGWRVVQESQ